MNPKRNLYLNMKPLAEARRIFLDAFPTLKMDESEMVETPDAVGRILAAPVTARVSSPNFHSAAMDGIAVRAKETFGAHESHPKEFVVGKQAFFVNTGHVMPENTDSVIMIEHVQIKDEQTVIIEAPASPWQHVRKMGEDIVATELLFPRNHQVTPYCVGALLSGGIYTLSVRKPPRVLIIPTGSELVNWRSTPPESLQPGQVLETNATVLGLLVADCGGAYTIHEQVMDDIEKIQAVVRKAVSGDYQMIMTIGGSSAGSKDYTQPVIKALGEVLVHGVTMMPGKPVILGRIEGKPVLGIPGYPVSAIIAFEQFAQPLLYAMQPRHEPKRSKIEVIPTRKIASKLGVEEFLRVKLGRVGDRVVAAPLPRGAGVITSLTEADGIIRIPNHIEGIKENESVSAELLKPVESIENTLIIVGSHDNTLDILSDELKVRDARLTLSSSHVGSMGGLMAVKRGACHLAGTHLLDTSDGSYNISYIQRILGDLPVKLIHLVMREQGLIVPKGNPKKIGGIEDLARNDVTFINRQGGSGTRILLDYRLSQLGISSQNIRGYMTEEFTHMSVAVAVSNGAADVGLGINAAAHALNLDFIPVVTEQYDLIIPQPCYEMTAIQTLLETINSQMFKKRVDRLGGYSTDRTGMVLM